MKKTSGFLLLMIVFYAVVAITALILLNGNFSVLPEGEDTPGAEPAVMSQTVIGQTDKKKDGSELPTIEPAVSEEDEPEIRDESEKIKIEDLPVIEPVETTVEEGQDTHGDVWEPRYFRFVVYTTDTILRIREAPSEDAEIIGKMGRGDTGYILQPGNKWCRFISATGKTGYCATEFLRIVELTEDEYPSRYIDSMSAPDEPLGSGFESRIVTAEEAETRIDGSEGADADALLPGADQAGQPEDAGATQAPDEETVWQPAQEEPVWEEPAEE